MTGRVCYTFHVDHSWLDVLIKTHQTECVAIDDLTDILSLQSLLYDEESPPEIKISFIIIL